MPPPYRASDDTGLETDRYIVDMTENRAPGSGSSPIKDDPASLEPDDAVSDKFSRAGYLKIGGRFKFRKEVVSGVLSKDDLRFVKSVLERDLAGHRIFIAPFVTLTAIAVAFLGLSASNESIGFGIVAGVVSSLALLGFVYAGVRVHRLEKKLDVIDSRL